MQGQLITLSGIDGAGKTTVAKKLVKKLENRGISAAYHYGRYDYNLAGPLMVIGDRFIRSDSDVRSGDDRKFDKYSKEKKDFLSNEIIGNLYELLSMADYLPFLYLSVWIKMRRNQYVICDRYLYDTLLKNFGGKLIENDKDAMKLMERYKRFVPEPDPSYYLDISVEEALDRKNDIPSLAHIEKQKRLYENFIPQTDMERINGEQNIDKVVRRIMRDVKND